MSKLSVEKIQDEVRRFWAALCAKDLVAMRRFYAAGAMVFNSSSSRHELGPLSVARRQREYFQRNTKMRVDLGDIHVMLLGEHGESAVASYTLHFHATDVSTMAGAVMEDLHECRASHVFAYGPDGHLYIMHEHVSLPVKSAAGVSTGTHTAFAAR